MVECDTALKGGLTRSARAVVIAALGLCTFVPAMAAAGGPVLDAKAIEALSSRLSRIEAEAVNDYIRGDSKRALDRLRAEVDTSDWQSLLVLGNMAWTMHPAESLEWHTRAYELSRQNDHVLLELAYHYTRQEECTKAVQAWERVDKAGLMHSYTPMIAGYCYLKLGDDERAFAMFDRAVLGKQGRFEGVLGELWGRRPELVEHADHLQALKVTGTAASLDAGLENSLRFELRKDSGAVLIALTDAAGSFAANLGAVARQLDCLRPALEREASDPGAVRPVSGNQDNVSQALASLGLGKVREDEDPVATEWRRWMDACGLLIEGHPLPDDPALVRLLAVNAISMKIASAKDLLAAHGRTLAARARSQGGDLESLRVLAAMQVLANDPGLTESDDLGWSRYGDPRFAASRVSGLIDDGKLSEEGVALLNRARTQFPDDQRILELWLRHANPSPDAARAGWRELALMEFHKPTLHRDPMHFVLSAPTLNLALRKYREAAGLKPKDRRQGRAMP